METLSSWKEFKESEKRLEIHLRAAECLTLRGYLNPFVQYNGSIEIFQEAAQTIEGITRSSFQDIETIALQSPNERDIEDPLRTYGSRIYALDKNDLVCFFDISSKHTVPSSSDPSVQRELEGIVMGTNLGFYSYFALGQYKPQSIEAIKLLWSLIRGFNTSLKTIVPDSGDLKKAGRDSIILFKNGKIIATGYHALDEIGLNLSRDKQSIYFDPEIT